MRRISSFCYSPLTLWLVGYSSSLECWIVFQFKGCGTRVVPIASCQNGLLFYNEYRGSKLFLNSCFLYESFPFSYWQCCQLKWKTDLYVCCHSCRTYKQSSERKTLAVGNWQSNGLILANEFEIHSHIFVCSIVYTWFLSLNINKHLSYWELEFFIATF